MVFKPGSMYQNPTTTRPFVHVCGSTSLLLLFFNYIPLSFFGPGGGGWGVPSWPVFWRSFTCAPSLPGLRATRSWGHRLLSAPSPRDQTSARGSCRRAVGVNPPPPVQVENSIRAGKQSVSKRAHGERSTCTRSNFRTPPSIG